MLAAFLLLKKPGNRFLHLMIDPIAVDIIGYRPRRAAKLPGQGGDRLSFLCQKPLDTEGLFNVFHNFPRIILSICGKIHTRGASRKGVDLASFSPLWRSWPNASGAFWL